MSRFAAPSPECRLVGVTPRALWVCCGPAQGEDAARFRYVLDRGGARARVEGVFVAEVGFDGVERGRHEGVIAHRVYDGIAVFNHGAIRHHPVAAIGQRLADGREVWRFARGAVRVWRSHVLGHDASGRLALATMQGDVLLAFDAEAVVTVVLRADHLVVVRLARIDCHSVSSGAEVWRHDLATGEFSGLSSWAIGDGCVWGSSDDGCNTLVGFELTRGEIVARHVLPPTHGGVHTAAHASWGALFVQARAGVVVTRREAAVCWLDRTSVSRCVRASADHVFAAAANRAGYLVGPSGLSVACRFDQARDVLLGSHHLGVSWRDGTLSAARYDELPARP